MKLTYKTLEHTFRCSEMKVFQYKTLLKNIYGEDIVPEEFLESFIEIFSEISNKPTTFFYDLSLYDLFLLLVQLRVNTLGETCQIIVSKNTEKDKKDQRTIHLNLKRVTDEYFFALETNFPQYVNRDNIVLNICPANLKRELSSFEAESWPKYIASCTIKKEEIEQTLSFQNNFTANKVIEKLPAQLMSQAINQINETLKSLLSINFLQSYEGCEHTQLVFVPTLQNLLWFCKLFFSESLDTFYSNLFYLSKVGSLDLNYIENCTPGELIYFINKVQQMLKEQNESSNQNQNQMIGKESSINGM